MDERHYARWDTITVAGLALLFGVLLLVAPINFLGRLIPTPFLPLIVIFLYGMDRPESLPPGLTFGMGLLHDLLFGAAIGPWASVYLLVHAGIIWQRSYFAGRDVVVLTTGFSVLLLLALLVYWFEMSIISGRAMPLVSVLLQGVITIAVFPLILTIFRRTTGRQRPSMLG
jgi:rod shape-determining protein MreD